MSEGSEGDSKGQTWPVSSDLLNYWYPLIFTKDLAVDKPVPVQLYGEPLVLFRGAEKDQVICLQDRCAHRSAALSIGAVVNGVIECRYHGWQYGKNGQCVRVPSMEVGTVPPGARVHSYPATIREDLVWVWPGDPEICSLERGFPSLVDELNHKSEWRIIDYTIDMDFAYQAFIENLLDPSHLQFTHEGQQGKFIGPRENTYLDLHESVITDLPTPGAFKAHVHSDTTLKVTDFEEIFEPPCTVVLRVNIKPGWKFHQVHYCVPTAEGKTRLLMRNMRTWLKFLPDFVMHQANYAVLRQDIAILDTQKLRMAQGSNRWNYPVKADSIGVKYRHWHDASEQASKPWFKGYVGSAMSKGGGIRRGSAYDPKRRAVKSSNNLTDIEDLDAACEHACNSNIETMNRIQKDAPKLWPSAKSWQSNSQYDHLLQIASTWLPAAIGVVVGVVGVYAWRFFS